MGTWLGALVHAREGYRKRNVYLGSARKMDAAQARQKAKAMKAEALEIKGS